MWLTSLAASPLDSTHWRMVRRSRLTNNWSASCNVSQIVRFPSCCCRSWYCHAHQSHDMLRVLEMTHVTQYINKEEVSGLFSLLNCVSENTGSQWESPLFFESVLIANCVVYQLSQIYQFSSATLRFTVLKVQPDRDLPLSDEYTTFVRLYGPSPLLL